MVTKILKHIAVFFRESTQLFCSRIKTKSGFISFAIASLILYGILSLDEGGWKNPLWMVWWGGVGGYGASLGEVAYKRWFNKKEKELEEKLKNPTGFTWKVTTQEGAFLGELNEQDYFEAKFEADTCFVTKYMQLFNILWVIWCSFVKSIAVVPALLVGGVLFYQYTGVNGSFTELTIGQLVESTSFSTLFFCLMLINCAILVFVKGFSGLPGYKNYYGLRLQRLLSKHLPNIANANGYTITGYKIDLENNSAEVSMA